MAPGPGGLDEGKGMPSAARRAPDSGPSPARGHRSKVTPSRLTAGCGAVDTAEGRGTSCSEEPFISQDVPLPSAPPPVRTGLGAQRSSGERALRCLRDPNRAQARHLPCGSGRANPAAAPALSMPIAACPFGHWVRPLRGRGRRPARWSYPPGGGCGFQARTTGLPAFNLTRRQCGTVRKASGYYDHRLSPESTLAPRQHWHSDCCGDPRDSF